MEIIGLDKEKIKEISKMKNEKFKRFSLIS